MGEQVPDGHRGGWLLAFRLGGGISAAEEGGAGPYIEAIAEKMRAGKAFGPAILTLDTDGTYGVPDGSHRLSAAAILGYETVPALVVESRDVPSKAKRSRLAGLDGCRWCSPRVR